MATQKLYALHDSSGGRLYIGGEENVHAHASDGEVILEAEVEDATAAVEYVRAELHYWNRGGGWYGDDVPLEALSALFATVRTHPRGFLTRWFDLTLEAERKADAPPAALEVKVEEAPEPDTSTTRAERRRRALEAGLIRPG
jgi:hypothetical protein